MRKGRNESSVFRLVAGLYTSDRDGRCDEAFERHAILRLAEEPSKGPQTPRGIYLFRKSLYFYFLL